MIAKHWNRFCGSLSHSDLRSYWRDIAPELAEIPRWRRTPLGVDLSTLLPFGHSVLGGALTLVCSLGEPCDCSQGGSPWNSKNSCVLPEDPIFCAEQTKSHHQISTMHMNNIYVDKENLLRQILGQREWSLPWICSITLSFPPAAVKGSHHPHLVGVQAVRLPPFLSELQDDLWFGCCCPTVQVQNKWLLFPQWCSLLLGSLFPKGLPICFFKHNARKTMCGCANMEGGTIRASA